MNGQKVDWALGSILYEINTLPWDYVEVHGRHHIEEKMGRGETFANFGEASSRAFLGGVVVVALLGLLQIIRLYRQNSRRGSGFKAGYQAVADASDDIEIEKLAPRSCPN